MSKHHLRHDKTCENCGHLVEERFCSKCGQENVETRQSFGHLFKHFMEDLTHYESNFWKTIKYLLFRPAYLTKTYLAGKRMTYVAPVKLYIFISFVAFFLPGIIPNINEKHDSEAGEAFIKAGDNLEARGKAITEKQDSVVHLTNGIALTTQDRNAQITLAQYDSMQASLPAGQKDGYVAAFMKRKFSYNPMLKSREGGKRLKEAIVHNFPKALFVYLPIFAFVLWLFHGKKRWYYFDHAIFTLHYFSFLLLISTILNVAEALLPWHFIMSLTTLSVCFVIFEIVAVLFYFYRGHRILYQEKGFVSFLKSSIILTINAFAFLFLFVGFLIFIIATAH